MSLGDWPAGPNPRTRAEWVEVFLGLGCSEDEAQRRARERMERQRNPVRFVGRTRNVWTDEVDDDE